MSMSVRLGKFVNPREGSAKRCEFTHQDSLQGSISSKFDWNLQEHNCGLEETKSFGIQEIERMMG